MKFNNINVQISPKAIIGANVKIGDNTVIYDNVVIGDNSIISNDCIIGEPLNDYYFKENYENPKTIIGENALIRSHTIIYADSVFGKNFSTGHRVTIREKSKFGNNCRLGTVTDIQGYVEFGDNCWLHSNVHIGQQSKIGNFVFMIYVAFSTPISLTKSLSFSTTSSSSFVGRFKKLISNKKNIPISFSIIFSICFSQISIAIL